MWIDNIRDPESHIHKLVRILGAYLFGELDLTDHQLLALKSSLVTYAEDADPGQVITLEGPIAQQVTQEQFDNAWAIVGKSLDGEPIVWHRPLPFEAEAFWH